MKDINFFSPYINKKRVKLNNKFFLITVFIILTIFLISYGLLNNSNIRKLSQSLHEYKIIVENPKTVKKVETIKNEEYDLIKFEEEVEFIQKIKNSVIAIDILGSSYISSITNKKPDKIFLTSLDISIDNISISGISEERLSIAEFAKGIATIEEMDDVFISNIRKNELNYEFDLEINDNKLGENDMDIVEDDQEVEDEVIEEEIEEYED